MGGLGTRMQQGTIDTGLSGGFWLVNNENPSSADGRWITSHGLTTQFDQIAELTQLQADAAFSDGSGPSDTHFSPGTSGECADGSSSRPIEVRGPVD